MKKNILKTVIALSIIIGGLVFYSCKKTEEINAEDNHRKEAVLTFENSIKSKSSEVAALTKSVFASKNQFSKKNRSLISESEQEKQESQAKESLLSLLEDSKKLLLEYGIDDKFLKEQFGDENNPAIINLGMYILYINKQDSKQTLSEAGFNHFFSFSTFADNNSSKDKDKENTIVDCAMEALGVPSGLILGSAKNLTTKAILKAAKKLATRTVGWLGAAVAVYEFGDCMNYW